MRDFLGFGAVLVMLVSGCSSSTQAPAGLEKTTFRIVNQTGHAVKSRVADMMLMQNGETRPVFCGNDEEGSGLPVFLDDGASIDIHYTGCHEVIGSGPVSFEIEYSEPSVDIALVDGHPERALSTDFTYPVSAPVVVILTE